MKRKAESDDTESSWKARYKKFRDENKRQYDEIWKGLDPSRFEGITRMWVEPPTIDMENFLGTQQEYEDAVESRYANGGIYFEPRKMVLASTILRHGQEFSLNARGIYYHEQFSWDLVVANRKIWIPILPGNTDNTEEAHDLRERSQRLAFHAKDNEEWLKSEYAWEADAWHDVFGRMRDDLCLAIDKRQYWNPVADTDRVTCKLTGSSTLVERIADATFALRTYADFNARLPEWTYELHRLRLERVLLHPKYGLYSDPRRDEMPAMVFPFMVYEAKGWKGDCREARRQACSVAAFYLDMLDELARRPGPVGTPRVYQTKTSHQYQVFVLTSFGAYWHLLVGYRRPRLDSEDRQIEGMSENVYPFQRIWSGDVKKENKALELLTLIDQIHLWAKTDHRTFVIEHLRPWHEACDKNFLLEWKSRYDIEEHLKEERQLNENQDLNVPSWVSRFGEAFQRNIQLRASKTLIGALVTHSRIKGKGKAVPTEDEKDEGVFHCAVDGCTSIIRFSCAWLDHLETTHGMTQKALAQIRDGINRQELIGDIEERREQNITATGRRWAFPWALKDNTLTSAQLRVLCRGRPD